VSTAAACKIFCDNSEAMDRSPDNEVSLNSKKPNCETTKLSMKHGRVLFCATVINPNCSAHILLIVRHANFEFS